MRPLITEARLRRDLTAMGIAPGMSLIVHSSLSAIGYVLGGAPTVVRALLDSIGDQGTLAMPAATPRCGDPAEWGPSAMDEDWLAQARAHLPLFDRRTTPTTMGTIAETFRTWPGTLRSDHPLESVCARGRRATEVVAEHSEAFSEGPGSPFAQLAALESHILLLGVGFDRCTALHHAESLAQRRRTQEVSFPTIEAGRRVWRTVPNVADDNGRLFPTIGARYVRDGKARQGLVGQAESVLVPMPDLVAFAIEQFDSLDEEDHEGR